MWQQRLFTIGGAICGSGALATVALLVTGVAGAVRLPVAVAAGVVGLAVGGAVANRADESTIRQFRGGLRPLLALFSPALAVGTATLAVYATVPDALAFWPTMTGVFLTFGGSVAMSHAADWLHVTRLEAETEHDVRLPGRFTVAYHRYGSFLIICGVGFALANAWLIWTANSRLYQLSQGLCLLSIGYSVVRNSEKRVLSGGIVSGVKVAPWDRYEGFAMTDENLVLHRDSVIKERERYPLDEIADVRGVTYTLSQYLGPAETAHV